MSLGSQVLQKIRLLLDKPISPLSQKQILALVDKQLVPAEQLLVTFYNKFRADLLIYVTERFPVPPHNLAQMLEFVLEKLLKFKLQQALKLWETVLSIKQCQTYRNEWGITNVLQSAIKNTNEQLKSNLFTLLLENTRLLWNWGEGRAVEELIKSYCRYFVKFNIYIASWITLLNYLLSIARQTKTELISRQNRVGILERLVEFLMATQNKQAFPFQNQSLKSIGELLQDKNYKITDHLLIHKCQKIMQIYLWKNPTRQQARKTQQEIAIAKEQLQLQNQGKMQRVEKVKKPKTPPILIEKVIDKTNQYRARQHLIRQLPSQSEIRTASTKHTFLKRQQGVGGGKSFLLFQKSPLKNNRSNIEFMLQQCFSSNAKKNDNEGRSVVLKESQKFNDRKNEKNAYNQRMHMEVTNSIFVQQQPQPQQMSQLSTVSQTSAMTLQQNWQYAQISNLIDLAYQYKFQPHPS